MSKMTVVILDRAAGPVPPYPEWLGDSGADLVLFTERDPGEVPSGGYAEVVPVPDFGSSSTVERRVLSLAGDRSVSAIVATAALDLVRAGALRDILGVPGQRRAEAILFSDPVAMRELLSRNGIPAVPCGPVQRVSDLYWYGHLWGYPLRVRERRSALWPELAVLAGEADVRAYTDGGLSPSLALVPSLLAQPVVDGVRRRVPGELSERVHAVLSALPGWSGYPYRVEAVHTAEGELIETVTCDVTTNSHREVVRAQAGLVAGAREVVRWAS